MTSVFLTAIQAVVVVVDMIATEVIADQGIVAATTLVAAVTTTAVEVDMVAGIAMIQGAAEVTKKAVKIGMEVTMTNMGLTAAVEGVMVVALLVVVAVVMVARHTAPTQTHPPTHLHPTLEAAMVEIDMGAVDQTATTVVADLVVVVVVAMGPLIEEATVESNQTLATLMVRQSPQLEVTTIVEVATATAVLIATAIAAVAVAVVDNTVARDHRRTRVEAEILTERRLKTRPLLQQGKGEDHLRLNMTSGRNVGVTVQHRRHSIRNAPEAGVGATTGTPIDTAKLLGHNNNSNSHQQHSNSRHNSSSNTNHNHLHNRGNSHQGKEGMEIDLRQMDGRMEMHTNA